MFYFIFQVETFDSMAALFMSSWDERMGSGDWGAGPLGSLVTTIKAGSSESVIILNGLDIVISPSMDLELTPGIGLKSVPHITAPKGCLMPSEINLKVGLMTLVRKPSMDISIMTALLDLDAASATENDQDSDGDGDDSDVQNKERERERERGGTLRVLSPKANNAHFPHRSDDISQALRAVIELDSQRGGLSTPEKSFPSFPGAGIGSVELSDAACGVATAPLLKVRFEASMAEISLSISADLTERKRVFKGAYPCNGSSRNSSTGKATVTPQSRQLVKPFSLHYVSSLDLHPFLPSPPLTRPSSAYNREYYLSPNSSTISSSYLSVEGLAINSSLLDLIRAFHVIETTTHLVRVSRGYGLVFNPSPPPKITPVDGLSSSNADSSTLPLVPLPPNTVESQRAVRSASLSMFKSSNVDILIVPASDSSAPAVLSLATNFVHLVLERPLSASDALTGSGSVLDAGITTTGSSALFTVPSTGGEGEGDSVASSPDDWSDWICEDVALNAIATCSAASAPAVEAHALAHTSPPISQTRTLMKLVCGNLVLSANGSPLFYLLENSTARDALSQVTRSGLLGMHRRQQAAAGDSAPFLLIRCELASIMPQDRQVKGESEGMGVREGELHLESTEGSESFAGVDGHMSRSAVHAQNVIDPRSCISLQIKVPLCTPKESSSKHSSGKGSAGKRSDGEEEEERRMGQVVLLPQVFEGCLHGLLRELLEGFG